MNKFKKRDLLWEVMRQDNTIKIIESFRIMRKNVKINNSSKYKCMKVIKIFIKVSEISKILIIKLKISKKYQVKDNKSYQNR